MSEIIQPEMLLLYYQKLFPVKSFYKWLSYGNDQSYFERREFSFTLPGDIYVRYQSFTSYSDLLRNLIHKLPEKLDIGAVFNTKPKEHSKNIMPLIAQERELVFDIDMTDYNDIRTCCKEAEICSNCWKFMSIAAQIIDTALREDFGFEFILWVFSGRRGIHGWVCDQRARRMKSDARSAVTDYLSLIEGGESKTKKVFLGKRGIHPSILRAINIIDKYFEEIIIDQQKLLETNEQLKKIIDLCIDSELHKILTEDSLLNKIKPRKKWSRLVGIVENYVSAKPKTAAKYFLQEVKLQLCYPRIDINVSKGLNHLLKSPFSVHPKTGKICIPIDIKTIDNFNPQTVVTLFDLQKQMGKLYYHEDESASLIYQRTSLKESIELFNDFVKNLGDKSIKLRKVQASLEF